MQAGQQLEHRQYLQVHRRVHAPAQQRELNRDRTALLELLDRTLDKGVLIEGRACVPVLGIEALTLDVRAVVASCERYLQYAHAVAQTMRVCEVYDDSTDTTDTMTDTTVDEHESV